MKKIKYLLICLSTISLLGCNETITLSKVNNITYSDGLLSFDAVEKAEGYNVKFSHLNEVVYEDKIKDTYLKVQELSKDALNSLEYVEEAKPEQEQLSFDMLNKESLKEVDDRMVIINNFLDDVEGK